MREQRRPELHGDDDDDHGQHGDDNGFHLSLRSE
jgi:hypothetical protein